MIHRGFNEDDGAVMLSLIGITNTIGMVSFVVFSDAKGTNLFYIYLVNTFLKFVLVKSTLGIYNL